MYPLIRRAISIVSPLSAIRFQEGATTVTVVVPDSPAGGYFLRGDGAADDLCLAIKTALEAATASTNTYSVTITPSIAPLSPTTTVTIARLTGSDAFGLLLAAPQTTFPLHVLGFTAVNTAVDALPKTSTLSSSAVWVSNDMLSDDEPWSRGEVYGEDPTRGGVILPGANSDTWDELRWRLAYVAHRRTLLRGNTADPNATWQALWKLLRSGVVCELGRIDPTTFALVNEAGRWVADLDTRRALGVERLGPGAPLYSWRAGWQRWVTP